MVSESTKRHLSEVIKKKYADDPTYRQRVSEGHKGHKATEETRRKMSASQKARGPRSDITREKMAKSKTGTQHSEKTKNMISEKLKQMWKDPEFRRLHPIRCTRKGMKNTEEHNRKISEANKNRAFTQEHKTNLSESHIGIMILEKHPNWQGGKSFEPYSMDWTRTLKQAIRERDNHTCRLCGKPGKDVHHIDYNKKHCDPKNLITLCRSCHMKTGVNRDLWTKYFNNL